MTLTEREAYPKCFINTVVVHNELNKLFISFVPGFNSFCCFVLKQKMSLNISGEII